MRISLVIPCYNEAPNLPALIESASRLTDNEVEVVFVDNGSQDSTRSILQGAVIHNPLFKLVELDENLGYGGGILAGLRVAGSEVLGWTHADLQTNPLDVLRAISFFESDSPNVFVKGLRLKRRPTERMFTLGMSIFESVLFFRVLRDINAQPTLFYRSFYESWVEPPSDFSLDLFSLVRAREANLKVHRIPVQFPERLHGSSNWNFSMRSRLEFVVRTISYSLRLRLR